MADEKPKCVQRDGRIGEYLPDLVKEPDSHALIRAWDGQRDPERISASFARLGIESVATPSGATVDLTRVTLDSLCRALFGFDEVWVGPSTCKWNELVNLPPMTSDAIVFGADDCDAFRSALIQSGASFGMADGCGVNIVWHS